MQKGRVAQKSLYQTLQAKFENNPNSFKKEIKVAGAFTGIFLIAIVASFFSLLNTYKKSVAKHEFLLSIYQNPKAKVVPTHKAQEFIEHKKLEAKHKRTLKAQNAAQEEYNSKMAEIAKVQQQLMAQNPMFMSAMVTPAYAPPQLDDEEAGKKEYNYSLCESIDYQQPMIRAEAPVPELETEQAAAQQITISKEQFAAMLKVAPELSALGVASTANQME